MRSVLCSFGKRFRKLPLEEWGVPQEGWPKLAEDPTRGWKKSCRLSVQDKGESTLASLTTQLLWFHVCDQMASQNGPVFGSTHLNLKASWHSLPKYTSCLVSGSVPFTLEEIYMWWFSLERDFIFTQTDNRVRVWKSAWVLWSVNFCCESWVWKLSLILTTSDMWDWKHYTRGHKDPGILTSTSFSVLLSFTCSQEEYARGAFVSLESMSTPEGQLH